MIRPSKRPADAAAAVDRIDLMGIGVLELALLLAVVVLMFGTGKLTRAVGDLARGVKAFRDEMTDAGADAPGQDASPRALPAPAAAPRGEVGHEDRPARP